MIQRAALALYSNGHLLLLSILVVVAAGASSFVGLPRMEDPRIRNRNPTIITAFPGASAERVDALVTEPLEKAVREVAAVKILKSESRPGISLIRIEIDDFAPDPAKTFALLRDKVGDIEGVLPREAGKPFFEDQRRAVGYSLIYALRGPAKPSVAPLEHTVAETVLGRLATELADRLRNLRGTEVVRVFGAPTEELAVEPDVEELAALGLRLEDVAARIRAADAKVPAGTIRATRIDLDVETRGELDSIARVAEVPVATDPESGAIVRVGDVAQLRRQAADPPVTLAFSGGERVILVAARITEATSIDQWTGAARRVVDGFRAGPAAGLVVDEVFVQQTYVNERLGGLAANLLMGGGIVVLVVLLLMGGRAAAIVATAIPLCTAVVMFTLGVLGIPIHQMSIFGLIIALGLLIDNAIVMTDEVAKLRRQGRGRLDAVRQAVDHLRVPLLSSTLTTALSFAPILLLPGNVGDFIGSIAVSVVAAVLASFALAMTVTAALAGRYLGEPVADGSASGLRGLWREGLSSSRLQRAYLAFLRVVLRRPLIAAAAVLAVPVLGFVQAGDRGLVFFPAADRNQFQVEVWMAPGTPALATAEARAAVEARLRAHREVEDVHWVVGASFPAVYYNVIERRDRTPHLAHGVVDLASAGDLGPVLRSVERELRDAFPHMQIIARRFGQGPPIDAPVELRLSGSSPRVLRELGEQVQGVLRRNPAVLETRATIEAGRPKVWFQADEDQLRFAGLSPTAASQQLRAGLDGVAAGSVLEGPEEIPVRVQLPDAARRSTASMLARGLVGPDGARVPVSAVGPLRLEPQTAAIARYAGVASNTVEAYLADGVNSPDVSAQALRDLDEAGFELPAGYLLQPGGDAAESGKAVGLLLMYAPVLVTLMLSALVLAFRSFALAGLMGLVAVGAAGSGLLALGIYGGPLGFNPFLGTAGLIGIAFNDAIVVLAALRAAPDARRGEIGAMVREVSGCTRHVLSTTFTTMGGFLPLLLFDKGDFWPPIAVVIGGGVLGSTLLALVLVPAAYRLIGAPLARREAAGTAGFAMGGAS